ncbi:MAG TPA: hypothetical protein VFO10_18755 [Oligoflexus sp.]|uniref:hypothetical protein n=1 Tax=Oligoflexus sp. TaxID=1971216 RepID=UPI002D80F9FA|nr:hypothetical protein [Oligoflexus sp.]HET9239308.1 hypothetical protein [Oligoflexus sp.]
MSYNFFYTLFKQIAVGVLNFNIPTPGPGHHKALPHIDFQRSTHKIRLNGNVNFRSLRHLELEDTFAASFIFSASYQSAQRKSTAVASTIDSLSRDNRSIEIVWHKFSSLPLFKNNGNSLGGGNFFTVQFKAMLWRQLKIQRFHSVRICETPHSSAKLSIWLVQRVRLQPIDKTDMKVKS